MLTQNEALYTQIRASQELLDECTPQCLASIVALTTCGNGRLEPENGETCDDGNQAKNDGCSDVCKLEDGWECPVP